MQKKFLKVTAVLTAIFMLAINIMPVALYAADEIQNTLTSEANVEFNATINGAYVTKAESETNARLDLALKVSNTGYVKDVVVEIEDANFELVKEKSVSINKIDGNKLYLNEVIAGEVLNASIELSFPEGSSLSKDVLSKDSKVSLKATYVNAEGNEKKIEKTITNNLTWEIDAKEQIALELDRYLKYDDKTMISFRIADGIEKNKVPFETKEITVNIPKISGKLPSSVIVNGASSYTYEDGVIVIKQENTPDNGSYSRNTVSVEDIILIYDTQDDISEIKISAEAIVKTIDNSELEAKVNEVYEVSGEVGSIVRLEAYQDKINKGHLYANIGASKKLETSFTTEYSVNVALDGLVDSIVVEEKDHKFNDTEIQAITSKKIIVDSENLKDILGDDGEIIVKSSDEELGKLSKDNTEIEVKSDYLRFEVSKPQKAGTLNIKVDKKIKDNVSYTREEIKSFNTLTTDVAVTGSKDNTVISNQDLAVVSALEEPTSKAEILASQKVLSTVVENKDLVFNIVLKSNEIEDMLYSNPYIKIAMPAGVNSINVTDAKLVYTDELGIENVVTTGNEIAVQISGTQTTYSSKEASVGPVLRIVADVTLNDLIPSSDSKGTLTVQNNASGEVVEKTFDMNIVAPTGFITLNKVEADGEVAEAIEENKEIRVSNGTEKATFTQTMVNNLEGETDGFAILGRIPSNGNRTIEGVSLGSNIDTTIIDGVKVSGIDAKVYYSDNADETVEGTTWSETLSANSKSYKVEAVGKVTKGTTIETSYDVALPTDKEGIVARSTYGVYYNNHSTEGITRNLVEAKAVGVSTSGRAQIDAKVEAVNEHSNEEITNGSEVPEGEYVKYRTVITNNGTDNLEGVRVNVELPEGLNFIDFYEADSSSISGEYSRYQEDLSTRTKIGYVGKVLPKESKTYEVIAKVYSSEEDLKASFKVYADKLDNPISQDFTIKPAAGTLRVNLVSTAGKVVEKDSEVTYRLELVNNTRNDMEDVKVTLSLPEGVEYVSASDESKVNHKEHQATINVGTLDAGDNQIFDITAKVTAGVDKVFTVRATATAKNIKEVKSNEISFKGQKSENGSSITASQSTNINGSSSDKDRIEFYIDIVNNGTIEKEVKLKDNLPDGLTVESYTLRIDGKLITEKKTSYIEDTFTIGAAKTARATIITSVDFLEEGKTASFTNRPAILDLTSKAEVKVNEVTVTVNGSGATTTNVSSGHLRISGTAWIDRNKDGRRDYDEGKVSGLEIMLYDLDNSSLAKSSKGTELRTTTDNSGAYTFEDLNAGHYVVVAKYDTANYILTSYQAANLSLAENSDFIDAKLNDELVAASDTITLQSTNVYNIDLGLAERSMFDLKLEKVITKITVSNTVNGNRVYEFNENDIAKVELSTKNVENTTVLVEYKIKITNEGKVQGYAKQIVDYIPAGMTFNSELNTTWYVAQDGNAYTTSLANTLIKPGETKEITLVLTKKMTGENVGTYRNTAEIAQSYNEQGFEDADSTPGNKIDGEDDISSADAIILMNTGREALSITGITLGSIAVIALAIYEIRKHVIYKVYDDMF